MRNLPSRHLAGVFLILAGVGCSGLAAGPKFDPIIRQGTWAATTRDQVFAGVIQALQDTGYTVKTAAQDTGLVEVEEMKVPMNNAAGAQIGIVEYRLTLVVSTQKTGAVSVSVQWKGHWKAFPNNETPLGNSFANNEIAKRIEELFASMEQTVGKAVKVDRNAVTWK